MQETAREFAIRVHGDQKYGDQPYCVHLDEVADIVKDFGDVVLEASYLHDVLEDTDVGVDELVCRFGSWVGHSVAICTDPPGRNRKERKAKLHEELSEVKEDFYTALIVKAADRLANMRACVRTDSPKLDMYLREYVPFRNATRREGLCSEIWDELDKIYEEHK